MLHEVQVSSAPRALRVSISTAVWMAGQCVSGLSKIGNEQRGARARARGLIRRTHVQATGNAGAREWLLVGVLLAGLDKTGHLLLGQLNLSSTKGREVDVRNLSTPRQPLLALQCMGPKHYLELLCWLSHICGVVV